MKTLLAGLLSLLVSGFAAAASLEEDVENYVKAFSGDRSGHITAARTLAWMGISDPRVYDIVDKLVKQSADGAQVSRGDRDLVNWYIRALGWSGNPKYSPTISTYASTRDYAKWGRDALEELPKFEKWNPIISNRATFDPKLNDDQNRAMNMLAAPDVRLKGHAAKQLYNRAMESVVQERLAQETKASYKQTGDEDTNDAIAWMLRALGSSRNPKYVAILEEALSGSSDRKIRNGAAAGLKYYR